MQGTIKVSPLGRTQAEKENRYYENRIRKDEKCHGKAEQSVKG